MACNEWTSANSITRLDFVVFDELGFGIAYFRYGASEDLKEGLEPVFDLADEQGIEAFYNLAMTPRFRVAADLQFLDPASGDFGDDVFAGVGTYVRF